jgi:hypothetical protein
VTEQGSWPLWSNLFGHADTMTWTVLVRMVTLVCVPVWGWAP